MVPLERRGVWDANGEIGKDGEELVGSYALEREVVRDFVDGEEEVVVRRAADGVRAGEEGQGERMGVTEVDGEGYLEGHDAEDDVFCEGLVAHEFCHLSNAMRPAADRLGWERRTSGWAFMIVRLLSHEPEEIGGVLGRDRVCVGMGRSVFVGEERSSWRTCFSL
jgi:hypothetical protein